MVKDNLYFCNSQQFFNSFHVSDLKKGIYAFFLDRTFVYCIHVDHNVCIIKICQQSPYIHDRDYKTWEKTLFKSINV